MLKKPPTGIQAEFEKFIAMMTERNPQFSVSCCIAALAQSHIQARDNRQRPPFPLLLDLNQATFSKKVGDYLTARRNAGAVQTAAA
jgi:hypothetical protein